MMTPDLIPISPGTRAVLLELSARTGRAPDELLAAAVEEYRQRLSEISPPATDVPGVDPADVWEADAQADAGRLTPHADVFARLRGRP